MATQDQKRKAAAQTGLYLAVLLAIAVAANVLSMGMNKRWDRTSAKRYTLSEGSGRLVAGLNSPIQIEAYVTKGLAQVDTFVRDLTDLLKEYERSSKGKFKFTIVEAKSDEQREAAKEAGLQEMAFGEASATGDDQGSRTGETCPTCSNASTRSCSAQISSNLHSTSGSRCGSYPL